MMTYAIGIDYGTQSARAELVRLSDGAVVVVRPDQYVAHVLPLTATAELSAFFGQHMVAQH